MDSWWPAPPAYLSEVYKGISSKIVYQGRIRGSVLKSLIRFLFWTAPYKRHFSPLVVVHFLRSRRILTPFSKPDIDDFLGHSRKKFHCIFCVLKVAFFYPARLAKTHIPHLVVVHFLRSHRIWTPLSKQDVSRSRENFSFFPEPQRPKRTASRTY